jgi:hypothetical protein
MAAPHAILERSLVPGDGLFLMQRPATRLRTPPQFDSDEEGDAIQVPDTRPRGPPRIEPHEDALEEDARDFLDEFFPLGAAAGMSRRYTVQSQEDDEAELMEQEESASIDRDFSMSLELRQPSDEDDEEAAAADRDRDFSMSLELRQAASDEDDDQDSRMQPASATAAGAAAAADSSSSSAAAASSSSSSTAAVLSQSSRQSSNSMVWSEIEELDRGSPPLLADWDDSQDPDPFVPPLETPEQIEAREQAVREEATVRLQEIAQQHAAVARQHQMRLLSAERAARGGSLPPRAPSPDIANLAPAQGAMSVALMQKLVREHESIALGPGGPFFMMQPAMYTLARKFQLTGPSAQRLIWSIKLDGNRALWDGWNQVLISKTSRIKIKPPSQWRLLMPRYCYLDGELFVPSENRVSGTNTEFAGALHKVALVWRIDRNSIDHDRSTLHDSEWFKFEFHAFDIVGAKLNNKPLSYRLGVLEATLRQFEYNHPTEKPVFRRVYTASLKGTTSEEVHELIRLLLDHYGKKLGAEGIVIKDLNSPYHFQSPGPVVGWLKAKYYEDVEAKVEVVNHRTKKQEKAVIIVLPDERETTQVVTYANGNLISADRLKKGMIVAVAFMPDPGHPESEKLRTPIIRSIVEDGRTWEEIKRRQREKAREVRQNS